MSSDSALGRSDRVDAAVICRPSATRLPKARMANSAVEPVRGQQSYRPEHIQRLGFRPLLWRSLSVLLQSHYVRIWWATSSNPRLDGVRSYWILCKGLNLGALHALTAHRVERVFEELATNALALKVGSTAIFGMPPILLSGSFVVTWPPMWPFSSKQKRLELVGRIRRHLCGAACASANRDRHASKSLFDVAVYRDAVKADGRCFFDASRSFLSYRLIIAGV